MSQLAIKKFVKPIVFFDGECILCNRGVQFIIKRDATSATTGNKIEFCRVQSMTGKNLLEKYGKTQQEVLDRFVILDTNDKIYSASTAALRLARYLPFPYPLLYGFIIVPPFIRNAIYDFVATNRYGWFGKYETCMMYRKDLMQRFVDQEEIDQSSKNKGAPSFE